MPWLSHRRSTRGSSLGNVLQWAVLSPNDLLLIPQGWMSMSKAINDTAVFSLCCRVMHKDVVVLHMAAVRSLFRVQGRPLASLAASGLVVAAISSRAGPSASSAV